jgi:carboxyl-terminal processing protease
MKKYISKLTKKRIYVPFLAACLLFTTTSYKSDFFEIAKQIEIFTSVFKEINMNYVDETEPAQLMNTAITSMLNDLDPYTHFWTEQEVEQGRIRQSRDYTGIGATLLTGDNEILIKEIFKGQPADEAGLNAGDEILSIDGVSISGFQEDAGQLLKGAPGSSVTLKFKRQGEEKTTQLKRQPEKKKAVPFYTLIDGKTGYVVLSKFTRSASKETKNAIELLKKQGAEKIILDLRGNPGGLLSEAVNTANLFLPKGQTIVTTKSVIEKYNKTYQTKKQPLDRQIPVAVLINGRSASASEIVSGSLQDLDRGVIIGAQSFGKGLVQRPKKLTYGTQMKITISRYYTPSGRCIQALNYRNRNGKGKAIRRERSDFKEFMTTNGRKVYGGGGIMPDIKMNAAKFSGITKALVDKQMIFDYATQFYYSHDFKSVADFNFTDSDYSDFLGYLNRKDFNYQTKAEKALAESKKAAADEDLQNELQDEYSRLQKAFKEAKENALTEKKPEIKRLLTDEILTRYFYAEGRYNYSVKENPEILEAVEVLNNGERYNSVLGK